MRRHRNSEFRKRLDDFGSRHARREIVQHILNRVAGVARTGLARPPCRIDCDEIYI